MGWRRLVLVGLVGCGARATPAMRMYPAGDHHDDASGLLARASYSLVTGPADDEPPVEDPDEDTTLGAHAMRRRLLGLGGDAYGGMPYGGLLYGGAAYGGIAVQSGDDEGSSWAGTPLPQGLSYETESELAGAIEGVISWQGGPAPRVATACGSAENPTLHVAPNHGLGGALVYIEKIDIGRAVPSYSHAVTTGGVVIKRGCALLPAAQIVAPLPATLTIHGDATASRLRATAQTGVSRAIDLQEAGQAQLDAIEGVVRIDSDDGKLSPAWIVGVESPYYAITDDAGRYRIDELSPGTYDVEIWQAPIARPGTGGAVAYGAPIVAHRKVTVGLAHAARLDVALK